MCGMFFWWFCVFVVFFCCCLWLLVLCGIWNVGIVCGCCVFWLLLLVSCWFCCWLCGCCSGFVDLVWMLCGCVWLCGCNVVCVWVLCWCVCEWCSCWGWLWIVVVVLYVVWGFFRVGCGWGLVCLDCWSWFGLDVWSLRGWVFFGGGWLYGLRIYCDVKLLVLWYLWFWFGLCFDVIYVIGLVVDDGLLDFFFGIYYEWVVMDDWFVEWYVVD